jgi:hypothetical protein
MGSPTSRAQLFELCVQDHGAAARLAARHLPTVAAAAGSELAPVVTSVAEQFGARCEDFARMVDSLDGPENLWMAGIMDDSLRDTRTIDKGPLLDIANVGAVRKALGADEVSLETAIGLAQALERTADERCQRAMRERERSLLDELKRRFARMVPNRGLRSPLAVAG